jgi:hypothetical protein
VSRYFLETERNGRLLRICDGKTGRPIRQPMEWSTATRLCLKLNSRRQWPDERELRRSTLLFMTTLIGGWLAGKLIAVLLLRATS